MPYYDKDDENNLSDKIPRQCDNCARIFQGEEGDNYCPSCDKQGGTDFQRVRAYIQENPGTDILSVSRATKVSAGLIMRYIKQGKIDTRK